MNSTTLRTRVHSRNADTKQCQSSFTDSQSAACGNNPAPPTERLDEYLTATLIEEVKADITALIGGWILYPENSWIAFARLSFRQSLYEASYGEWRVTHLPQGTCYLKVWAEQIFTPDNGDAATATEVLYEWDKTLTGPCIPDETKSVGAVENEILGPVNAVAVPETNGNITLEITRWSFVKGYEPDISDPLNKQPNGFPNPAWEPAAP